MAIARADYEIFKALRDDGCIPADRTVLEIGEAEFFGDVSMDELRADIREYAPPAMRDALLSCVAACVRDATAGVRDGIMHRLAKVVYQTFFGPCRTAAIDLHGTPAAKKVDLNEPFYVAEPYGVVYNTGTVEHVFNIGQVLHTIHNATAAGGLMVHCFPFTGLIDHGFYAIQPGLIDDLAEANGYEILAWTLSEPGGEVERLDPTTAVALLHEMARDGTLPANAWFHVAYRKPGDGPFKVPRQRIYGDRATRDTIEDWHSLR